MESELNCKSENTQLSKTEINKKLCKFDEFTEDIICPNCGYEGHMGLVKKNVSPIGKRVLSFLCAIITASIVSFMFEAGIIISGIFFAIAFSFFDRIFRAKIRKFVCPNCDSVLFDK